MKGNIVVAANLNSTEVRKTHFIIIDYIYIHTGHLKPSCHLHDVITFIKKC